MAASRPNLTLSQLVKVQGDASPLPNHSLVLCRRVEAGYVIRRVLPPNRVFRPALASRRRLFFSYAVPHGKKWLSFTRSYSTPEPASTIQLSFIVTYHVQQHVKLIEMLGDDPLRAVQSAVEAEFGRAIQQLTWASLLSEGMVLERFSLPLQHAQRMSNNDAILAALFAGLQAFALEYGLLIMGLSVSRDLSAQEHDYLDKRENLRHEEELQRLRHRITLKDSTFDELLAKLRLLISRTSGPATEGWSETIEELRQFVKMFQEFVALPASEPAQLASSAKSLPARDLGNGSGGHEAHG
jgi:hypothetical protein